jgi:hypothetical protein
MGWQRQEEHGKPRVASTHNRYQPDLLSSGEVFNILFIEITGW